GAGRDTRRCRMRQVATTPSVEPPSPERTAPPTPPPRTGPITAGRAMRTRRAGGGHSAANRATAGGGGRHATAAAKAAQATVVVFTSIDLAFRERGDGLGGGRWSGRVRVAGAGSDDARGGAVRARGAAFARRWVAASCGAVIPCAVRRGDAGHGRATSRCVSRASRAGRSAVQPWARVQTGRTVTAWPAS